MVSLYIHVSGNLLQRTEYFQFFGCHWRYLATEREGLVHVVVTSERRIKNSCRAFNDGAIFELVHIIVVDLTHSFARLRTQSITRYTFAVQSL